MGNSEISSRFRFDFGPVHEACSKLPVEQTQTRSSFTCDKALDESGNGTRRDVSAGKTIKLMSSALYELCRITYALLLIIFNFLINCSRSKHFMIVLINQL